MKIGAVADQYWCATNGSSWGTRTYIHTLYMEKEVMNLYMHDNVNSLSCFLFFLFFLLFFFFRRCSLKEMQTYLLFLYLA